MQLQFFELDTSNETRCSFEVINLIESNEVKIKSIEEYKETCLSSFNKSINNTMEKYFFNTFDFLVKAYIVPFDIKSNYSDSICDGFAYKSDDYCIVVSQDTDVVTVLCHELCHIIAAEIFPEISNLSLEESERLVEEIEEIMRKNVFTDSSITVYFYLQKKYFGERNE